MHWRMSRRLRGRDLFARKIVDGMAPGQAALYSASMGVTVLLTTTKSLLLYNNDFLHFIALYDWKDWSRSKVSVSCHAKLGRGVRRFRLCILFGRSGIGKVPKSFGNEAGK